MDWTEYKLEIRKALETADFASAEKYLLGALKFLKDTNQSQERMCLCLDQLGFVYFNQSNLQRAEECYLESMELKRLTLGPQNPIVAKACKKLATVVYLQQKFDLAEKYSKESLKIFTNTLGPQHEETRQTMEDLIALLRKLNRNVEANILEQQANATNKEATKYEGRKSLFNIKVCPNCNFPYDGDRCIRCSDIKVE